MSNFVDTHYHLLAEDTPFHGKYTANDHTAAAGPTRQGVCVETGLFSGNHGEEVGWLRQELDLAGLDHSIIGGVDLGSIEAATSSLKAQVDAAGFRFKGVRVTPESLPKGMSLAEALTSDAFDSAAKSLTSHGLLLELWTPFDGLPAVADLHSSHPDLTIVLEHLGGPIRGDRNTPRSDALQAWDATLSPLADLSRIHVKISGLAMPFMTPRKELSDITRWESLVDYWADPAQRVLQLFGADRCMLGSNFPMDDHLLTYADMSRALTALADLADRPDQVLGDTARRVYSLAAQAA